MKKYPKINPRIFGENQTNPRYWEKSDKSPGRYVEKIQKESDKPPVLRENSDNPPPVLMPNFFSSLMSTCPDDTRLLRLVVPRCRAPNILFFSQKQNGPGFNDKVHWCNVSLTFIS